MTAAALQADIEAVFSNARPAQADEIRTLFGGLRRALAEGRVRTAPLITARVPLERAVTDGLEALLRREEGHIKVLVTPRPSGRT